MRLQDLKEWGNTNEGREPAGFCQVVLPEFGKPPRRSSLLIRHRSLVSLGIVFGVFLTLLTVFIFRSVREHARADAKLVRSSYTRTI